MEDINEISCDEIRSRLRSKKLIDQIRSDNRSRQDNRITIEFDNEYGGESQLEFLKKFMEEIFGKINLNTYTDELDLEKFNTKMIEIFMKTFWITITGDTVTFSEAIDIGGITKHFLNLYIKTLLFIDPEIKKKKIEDKDNKYTQLKEDYKELCNKLFEMKNDMRIGELTEYEIPSLIGLLKSLKLKMIKPELFTNSTSEKNDFLTSSIDQRCESLRFYNSMTTDSDTFKNIDLKKLFKGGLNIHLKKLASFDAELINKLDKMEDITENERAKIGNFIFMNLNPIGKTIFKCNGGLSLPNWFHTFLSRNLHDIWWDDTKQIVSDAIDGLKQTLDTFNKYMEIVDFIPFLVKTENEKIIFTDVEESTGLLIKRLVINSDFKFDKLTSIFSENIQQKIDPQKAVDIYAFFVGSILGKYIAQEVPLWNRNNPYRDDGTTYPNQEIPFGRFFILLILRIYNDNTSREELDIILNEYLNAVAYDLGLGRLKNFSSYDEEYVQVIFKNIKDYFIFQILSKQDLLKAINEEFKKKNEDLKNKIIKMLEDQHRLMINILKKKVPYASSAIDSLITETDNWKVKQLKIINQNFTEIKNHKLVFETLKTNNKILEMIFTVKVEDPRAYFKKKSYKDIVEKIKDLDLKTLEVHDGRGVLFEFYIKILSMFDPTDYQLNENISNLIQINSNLVYEPPFDSQITDYYITEDYIKEAFKSPKSMKDISFCLKILIAWFYLEEENIEKINQQIEFFFKIIKNLREFINPNNILKPEKLAECFTCNFDEDKKLFIAILKSKSIDTQEKPYLDYFIELVEQMNEEKIKKLFKAISGSDCSPYNIDFHTVRKIIPKVGAPIRRNSSEIVTVEYRNNKLYGQLNYTFSTHLCSNGIDMPVPYDYTGSVVPIDEKIKEAFKGGLELLFVNQ